jgi:hypothetical protein
MLPLAVVEEIRRLLDEGTLSQRKIAAKLDVSRGTVGAIACGKRGLYGREPDPEERELTSLDLLPERCRGCGAMVHMPCVLCRARRYAQRQRALRELSLGKRPRPTSRGLSGCNGVGVATGRFFTTNHSNHTNPFVDRRQPEGKFV